jgi:glutathione peroxidase
MDKIQVNGRNRHPLYKELTEVKAADGKGGRIQWNFEKFLIGPDGSVAGRFRPRTEPEAAEIVSAIEARLPAAD